MKKIKYFVFLILSIVLTKNCYSQADNLTHIWTAPFYVGWNTANNLDFGTNIAGPGRITYMTLDQSTNVGFLSIGKNFTTPQSQLHIHMPTASTAVYAQWTDNTTTAL